MVLAGSNMARGSKSGEGSGDPERKCIVSGEVQTMHGLIRFVVGPDGQIFADILGKLPGRGIWVSADRAMLEEAVKKGLFGKAARQKVTVPEDLIQEVDRQLARRTVDLISMSRKGGHAITGYEKVKDWLIKDYAEVLIQSSDGSERGKSKLSTPYEGSFIGWLTSDELGLAFGRQTVIHAALASGGLTPRIVEEAQRLKGVRGFDGAKGRRKG